MLLLPFLAELGADSNAIAVLMTKMFVQRVRGEQALTIKIGAAIRICESMESHAECPGCDTKDPTSFIQKEVQH